MKNLNLQEKDKKFMLLVENLRVWDVEVGILNKWFIFVLYLSENRYLQVANGNKFFYGFLFVNFIQQGFLCVFVLYFV